MKIQKLFRYTLLLSTLLSLASCEWISNRFLKTETNVKTETNYKIRKNKPTKQKQFKKKEGGPMELGKEFLEQNKKKDGVQVTPSSLQYKVIKEGVGQQPTASDSVEVHYKGTLTDGTEFDSSYKRNETITFPLNGVISGWTEGLQLMKEGAKYQFYIPPHLAYGSRDLPGIPAHSVLIFDVELIKVK